MDKKEAKRDLAARAAWLYYMGQQTQEEIARTLSVSRIAVHRLLALAHAEKIVTVRINRPIADCMALGEELARRFAIEFCEVVPNNIADLEANRALLAAAGAGYLERVLDRPEPMIIGVGNGRTLKAVVDELSTFNWPHHKVVSIMGNMARDASCHPYEIISRFADKINARRYMLPTPIVADTVQDRIILESQKLFRDILSIAESADLLIIGLGHLDGENSPMLLDGIITETEYRELIALGGVGDIMGYVLDGEGHVVTSSLSQRTITLPLQHLPGKKTVVIAGGDSKVPIIRAALHARLISGLITDERAATRILANNGKKTTA